MSVFGANDIRGLYPREWDSPIACDIGHALPEVFDIHSVVVGRDIRESSDEIRDSLVRGLGAGGVDIADLGLVDTPAIYFATGQLGFDLGLMITASHNPPQYNGIKLVGRGAAPIDEHSGLDELKRRVTFRRNLSSHSTDECPQSSAHRLQDPDLLAGYVSYLQSFVDSDLEGVRVVFDCSNGMAARFIRQILRRTKVRATIVNETMDGRFPAHGPNPSLPHSLDQVRKLVQSERADAGFCFDGDGDRVVMVDNYGEVVSPDLMTAILGLYYFRHRPEKRNGNTRVLVDIRSSNSVTEFLRQLGAETIRCPIGHARVKRMMRETDAVFGGELTGHYYFKEFFYCDTPWVAILRVLSVLAHGDETLSTIRSRIMKYHFSGEITFSVDHQDAILEGLLREHSTAMVDTLDGFRFDYPDWWFLVRKSSTEPYLRLVVEANDHSELVRRREQLTRTIYRLESESRRR